AAGLALTSRWTAGGRAAKRSRAFLVVTELALAVALSTGAGLLLRSFARLRSADRGLRGEHVLSFHIALPEARYGSSERVGGFERELLSRLERLPGVRSTGAIFGLPFTGASFSSSFTVAGHPVREEDEPSAQLRVASRGYFRTVGIRLLRGRLFDASDRPGSPPVILASESAVRKFWPSRDAIGERLRFGASPVSGERLGGEIIGVVSDVRENPAVPDRAEPFFYASLDQRPIDEASFVLATAADPRGSSRSARREVARLDPGIPVTNVATVDELAARTFARLRFLMLLLLVFAGASMLLAALGVWGVMSAVVGHRAREIAVRIAVGAGTRDVLRLVLGQAMALAGAGIAAGSAIAMISSRALSRFLFEVSPSDPVTLAAAALALSATALFASFLPATRAARIDPVTALRA
ncbi:MAG TPA: FtsX-like permease family protein, partial [Thermoanaerobaculia bacterium]